MRAWEPWLERASDRRSAPACRSARRCRSASALPSGHAGLASGPLIVRDGDVFGRTVNLAARVADVTPDGRLYAPEDVASVLPPERFDLRPTGGAQLQAIGPVALVEVARPR